MDNSILTYDIKTDSEEESNSSDSSDLDEDIPF